MLVAIDPGTRSGIAVFSSEPGIAHPVDLGGVYLREWRIVKLLPSQAHGPIALEELKALGVGHGDHVPIEDQWLQPGKSNPKSVAALIERRCAWQHAAEILGATVELVRSDVWMRWFCGGQLALGGSTTAERVRDVVCELLDQRLSLDEAAAVGIGLWVIRRENRGKHQV